MCKYLNILNIISSLKHYYDVVMLSGVWVISLLPERNFKSLLKATHRDINEQDVTASELHLLSSVYDDSHFLNLIGESHFLPEYSLIYIYIIVFIVLITRYIFLVSAKQFFILRFGQCVLGDDSEVEV